MSETKSSKPFEDLTPEYQRLHSLVDRYLNEWIETMGLSDWSFDTSYYSTHADEDASIAALISPQWEYMQAGIKIFLPQLMPFSDREVEFVVVHELCHCLVCHMRGNKLRRKLEEKTVTLISKAFLRSKYDPRPNPSTEGDENISEKPPDKIQS